MTTIWQDLDTHSYTIELPRLSIVGEEAGTIEEVYEPFLIQEGYLKRTPRGREATEIAYKHLGRKPAQASGSLFSE